MTDKICIMLIQATPSIEYVREIRITEWSISKTLPATMEKFIRETRSFGGTSLPNLLSFTHLRGPTKPAHNTSLGDAFWKRKLDEPWVWPNMAILMLLLLMKTEWLQFMYKQFWNKWKKWRMLLLLFPIEQTENRDYFKIYSGTGLLLSSSTSLTFNTNE